MCGCVYIHCLYLQIVLLRSLYYSSRDCALISADLDSDDWASRTYHLAYRANRERSEVPTVAANCGGQLWRPTVAANCELWRPYVFHSVRFVTYFFSNDLDLTFQGHQRSHWLCHPICDLWFTISVQMTLIWPFKVTKGQTDLMPSDPRPLT